MADEELIEEVIEESNVIEVISTSLTGAARRNAVFNADGVTFDIEVEHPQFGWIPTTLSPHDAEPTRLELYEAVLAEGAIAAYVPPEPPTPEETRAKMPPLSRRKFKKGMLRLNITDAMIQGVIDGISDPVARYDAQIDWDESGEFSRTFPLIVTMLGIFGKDPLVVDSVWMEVYNLP